MKKPSLSPQEIAGVQRRYQSLKSKLLALGPISQGTVVPHTANCWRWTRKVAGKTVSRGLSAHQAELMRTAIANQRELTHIIEEMRSLTQKLILGASESPAQNPPENRPKSPLS